MSHLCPPTQLAITLLRTLVQMVIVEVLTLEVGVKYRG